MTESGSNYLGTEYAQKVCLHVALCKQKKQDYPHMFIVSFVREAVLEKIARENREILQGLAPD